MPGMPCARIYSGTHRSYKTLKQRYNLYLLSNTNQIHYNYFANAYKEQIGGEFDSLFTKAYYSYQLGLRKPFKRDL
jgi:putative hydrolase of the HAD superfamily